MECRYGECCSTAAKPLLSYCSPAESRGDGGGNWSGKCAAPVTGTGLEYSRSEASKLAVAGLLVCCELRFCEEMDIFHREKGRA